MNFQIDGKTANWLLQLQALQQNDLKPTSASTFLVEDNLAKHFQNGLRIAPIVKQIFRTRGLPPPQFLTHLKASDQLSAKLYNWNGLNETLKKLKFEIDYETKSNVLNGDREHLAMVLRQLHQLYLQNDTDFEDSLDQPEVKPVNSKARSNKVAEEIEHNQSLSLSHSQQPQAVPPSRKNNGYSNIHSVKKVASSKPNEAKQRQSDLLAYVVSQLMGCINITRQQAIALLQDNNKYLAHVLVKGVKGEFTDIERLMERWFMKVDFIVQRMADQNDMCFFFLQVIKPALLSKSEEVAQWACRLLSRIAHQLANKDLLPLAYDWFVKQAGGLETTHLALGRHPKLNEHVVGFILQFSRFNVAEVFTLELKKITDNDQLSYIKFILLLFQPLTQAKASSEELLNSGAIDYWVQTSLKGASQPIKDNGQLKLYSLQLLTKLWRAYPVHMEEQLDKVNQIMTLIKRGIREGSEVMRYTLLQLLLSLLDEFASKRNPYASVVYKKLTFLFIQNHNQLEVRQFMLRNFGYIIQKYQSIPVDIFLEPFVKQIKIKENESYFLNIFDLQFITQAVTHRKLSPKVALQFLDLLAKIKLNNHDFTYIADLAMDQLLSRFLSQDIFLQYTAKLVKVSLAKFYNTLKHKNKGPMSDKERLLAQKRAEIVNFIISLLERGPVLDQKFNIQDKVTGTLVETSLYFQIKTYVVQVKVQIQRAIGGTHKGIQRILELFPNVQSEVKDAMEYALQKEDTESNMTSQTSKQGFRLPKIEPKYLSKDRDEVSSQQSGFSQGTRYSNRTKQQFPQQDYTKFAQEDQKKFLKEHGIGFKKKQKVRRPPPETQVDPKVQEQLLKAKVRKEEEEKKKLEQQQKIRKRKELLQNKIQKELEQRNILQGLKGNQKDVEVKVVFEQNQINQKLLEQEDLLKQLSFNDQEMRDIQSVKIVIKKHMSFLRKLFNRYSSGKMGKKDFFQEDNENLAQVDLLRICKEKNLQKNKSVVIQILKHVNDKNIKSLTFDTFLRFLQTLIAYVYLKQKLSTHYPMGDLAKAFLRKMSVGQNFRLQDDQDETSRGLTEKVRYNPHIELPDGYKKVYERVYDPKRECSFPTKKALRNESFTTCYEIVNDLLFKIFKFHTLQEQVRFFQEGRVIKKNIAIPPRPLAKKEKEEAISLLEDKQPAPTKARRTASINKVPTSTNRSIEKVTSHAGFQKQNKPKPKVVNAAERRKMQQEDARRTKKQQQEEQFKKRQQDIKKRMEKMQEEKQRQNSRKKQQTKATREQEEEKKKRQKEEKERYQKQQKQKLEKYRRERQDREKEEKDKQQILKQKQEEERRQKMKQQMKREEVRRKEEAQRSKKERELSEQKNRKKKEEEQKKNKLIKEQVQKKLQEEKNKYQVQKLYKELLKNIYQQNSVQTIFGNFKDQIKGLFNYGREYNQYKLGSKDEGLQQKGWNTICQQFGLADPSTANSLIKQNQKEKGRQGFLFDDFQQVLLSLSVKQKQLEPQLDDYEKAKQTVSRKVDELLRRLKIPRDKQTMKDYFVGLKNSLKKKEQVAVVGPGGEQQTWQVQK